MFQSTRPCGARQQMLKRKYRSLFVSIHAPVRGATLFPLLPPRRRWCFNPRARAGRDPPTLLLSGPHYKSFNPRARAGRDTTSCRSSLDV